MDFHSEPVTRQASPQTADNDMLIGPGPMRKRIISTATLQNAAKPDEKEKI